MGCASSRPAAAPSYAAKASSEQPALLPLPSTTSSSPASPSPPLPPPPAAASSSSSLKRNHRGEHPHRERVVFAKGLSEHVQLEKILKTPADVASILHVLDQCYVFSGLSREQKEDLASYMRALELRRGEPAPHGVFCGVRTGEFELTTTNVAVVDAGQRRRWTAADKEPFWGEMALMFDDGEDQHSLTITCTSSGGSLWTIDRDTFRQAIASSNEQQREEKRLAVSAIPLLRDALSGEHQLNRLIECVYLLRFPAHHEIVRKGERGEVCYFIKQGRVLCSRIGENQLGQVELGPGSYFGERALLRDEPRAADVHALPGAEEVVVMCIARRDFDDLLGPLRTVMDANMKERVVDSLPILKELNPRVRQEVVADFELESFREGDLIVRQGDDDPGLVDKFYVVRAGAVRVEENGVEIAVLREGNWFGEMALLNSQPRVASCYAASPEVECFVLRRATFQTLVQESTVLNAISEQRQASNLSRRGTSTTKSPSPPPPSTPKIRKERKLVTTTLGELERHHILGKGTFGTVYLVSHNRRFFALKSMNKANLVRCEQRANVMNEKRILLECGGEAQHPFILQLYQTYQDRDTLYMLLEFVQGGELFSMMQDKFRFPVYAAAFYSACILDVFEHVHSLGVVYRDLKPENVLIDKYGYVKLADFGFAKHVTDKTYTLCGTPEYLAPEVVLGSGHDKGVDYWGVGILIYEMLVGISPFADEYDDDQHVVCNNIVRGRVAFDRMHAAIRDTEHKQKKEKGDGDAGYWTPPSSKPCIAPQPATPSGSSSKKPATAAAWVYVEVEDLVKRLLVKNPVQRLGNLKDGAREVKRHAFFTASSIFSPHDSDEDNNDRLRSRRVVAPHVPKVSSAHDSSRFDKFEPDAAWPAYKGSQEWCSGF